MFSFNEETTPKEGKNRATGVSRNAKPSSLNPFVVVVSRLSCPEATGMEQTVPRPLEGSEKGDRFLGFKVLGFKSLGFKDPLGLEPRGKLYRDCVEVIVGVCMGYYLILPGLEVHTNLPSRPTYSSGDPSTPSPLNMEY